MKTGMRHEAIGDSKKVQAFGFALCTLLLALGFPVEAQQSKKVPRIGLLTLLPSPDPLESIFLQGLRDLGYDEGRNIIIEYRRAAGKVEHLPELAGELVRLNVDLIVVRSGAVVQAAKNATNTIPIVMMEAADPVGSGFVASLARPGGNITGMSVMMPELAGKRVELLKEIIPKLSGVAFLAHSGGAAHKLFVKEAQEAAERFGMKFQSLIIAAPQEVEGAFSAMISKRAGAVIIQPLFIVALGQGQGIADLAVRNRLATVSDVNQFAAEGGLISYGPDQKPLFRRAATYVDKILKGAKPSDLPVEQPMKFELMVNLKTAKALNLTIPQSVLYRADKVVR